MSEQRLFISHASEDTAVAEKIVAYLEARGVPCWISSRDIPPRAIYADAIVEGMQKSEACAVLVSAASNVSRAVKREVELASHENKDFIPIRIDGSEPASGLAYYLRNSQWVEYKRNGDRALDRIANHDAPAEQVALTPARGASQRNHARYIIAALALVVVSVGVWGIWYTAFVPETTVIEDDSSTAVPAQELQQAVQQEPPQVDDPTLRSVAPQQPTNDAAALTGRRVDERGRQCRTITALSTVNGQEQRETIEYCQQPDGTWERSP